MSEEAPVVVKEESSLFQNIAIAAVLLAAFLMFLIQPLVAKAIVPWFGGAASTWSVVMLYFQALLLMGYFTSFVLQRMTPRVQSATYIVICVLALLFSYTQPYLDHSRVTNESPIVGILYTLLRYITFPGLLLATVSTMVQVWYSSVYKREPYILYSISNIGSLAALLLYPFLIEPNLTLVGTFVGWQILMVACALCCMALAVLVRMQAPAQGAGAAQVMAKPSPWRSRPGRILLWTLLPACSTALLIAVTQYLCHDIAPIPLLWIVPLAIYLITYILAFGPARRVKDLVWVWVSLVAIALFFYVATPRVGKQDWLSGTTAFLSSGLILLFALCQFCHSYLVALRPGADRLTTFYLCLAVGGFIGSFLVNLIFPFVFLDNSDLWLCIMACSFVLAWRTIRTAAFWGINGTSDRVRYCCLLVAIGLSVFYCGRAMYALEYERTGKERNFYGILKLIKEPRILKEGAAPENIVKMAHGVTVHGRQFAAPEKMDLPTAYYGYDSGIGKLLMQLMKNRTELLSIGVIGLGAGTLSTYGRAGDSYTYYEINPAVVKMAKAEFTFMSRSKATQEIILGDARLSLADGPPKQFDVLVVDAFSSDAVPAHLLTREVFAIYLKHVKPDGFLAFHISNRYLDLSQVVTGAAEEHGLTGYYVYNEGDASTLNDACQWMILSRKDFPKPENTTVKPVSEIDKVLWTDDYSNLFRIIRW